MSQKLNDFKFKSSDGRQASFSDYAGKVLLVVNVASKCGLTPQYEGLENLFEKYRELGFSVLAFPANEFGAQEPGTNAEIQEFCRTNFGVQFPVFEKIIVKGEGQHPLYKFLTTEKPQAIKNPKGDLEKALSKHGMLSDQPSDITWNFEKFLISRKGEVVRRFAPDIAPGDPLLVQAIEAELGKK